MFSPMIGKPKTFRTPNLQAWPEESELKPHPVEAREVSPLAPSTAPPPTDAVVETPAPVAMSAAVPMSEAEVSAAHQLSAEAIYFGRVSCRG